MMVSIFSFFLYSYLITANSIPQNLSIGFSVPLDVSFEKTEKEENFVKANSGILEAKFRNNLEVDIRETLIYSYRPGFNETEKDNKKFGMEKFFLKTVFSSYKSSETTVHEIRNSNRDNLLILNNHDHRQKFLKIKKTYLEKNNVETRLKDKIKISRILIVEKFQIQHTQTILENDAKAYSGSPNNNYNKKIKKQEDIPIKTQMKDKTDSSEKFIFSFPISKSYIESREIFENSNGFLEPYFESFLEVHDIKRIRSVEENQLVSSMKIDEETSTGAYFQLNQEKLSLFFKEWFMKAMDAKDIIIAVAILIIGIALMIIFFINFKKRQDKPYIFPPPPPDLD